jgi:hypothetical protein
VVVVFAGMKRVGLDRAFGGGSPIVPSAAIIIGVIGSLLFPTPPEEAPWPWRKSAS